MAIAEMRKLNLAAMSYEKDKILNALQRTGAVEVKTHSELECTVPVPTDCEGLRSALLSAEAALGILAAAAEDYIRENKLKSDLVKDGFDVPYSEFMAARGKKEEIEGVIARVNALTDEKNRLNTDLAKTARAIQTAKIYSAVTSPLSDYTDTPHAAVRLGVLPLTARESFRQGLAGVALADCAELAADEEQVLVLVVSHKSAVGETDGLLASLGFAPCPFVGGKSGAEVYTQLQGERERLELGLRENALNLFTLHGELRSLKVYCDFLGFELEKAELNEKFLATERTFLLEAYVPSGAEQSVEAELKEATGAVYFEFSEVPADEMPPTLMKNNAVVSNFETITNMYSPPNAREFDPSTVMGFFYSVFLGFIMADIGYGLMMLLGGGAIYYKTRSRDSGLKRLSGVFAIGGIFAIIWGLLFNSLFGISFSFLPTVMPDAQNDMWTIAGIRVPAVLVVSLLIGVVQLFAAYACKALQSWRKGKILDGVCDGATWMVFSVGAFLAIVGFIDEMGAASLIPVGGILAAVGLVAAMLTAGRKEKVIGKFTKGFGAAYSVINYASDILSYARLYGLMLSGAVIAQIVSQYAVGFITGGNVIVAVLGVLLMIVGHVFNLAMSLLSAYIHDARLQYMEFYGKFFEGDGELFAPLGSRHKYIYLTA